MATFIQVGSGIKTAQKGKEEKIGGSGCVLYLHLGGVHMGCARVKIH